MRTDAATDDRAEAVATGATERLEGHADAMTRFDVTPSPTLSTTPEAS